MLRIFLFGLRHWSWIALAGVIALAARPFWDMPQFFYTDDGLLHLLRLFAFDQTVHQGVVLPRWLGDLAWGMGYPIFDFYPPLATYIAESLHVLGFGYAPAVQTTFVIVIAVAACGAFVMGAELYSGEDAPISGLLTAVAYVFFPYILIDVFTRGALAEALAAAFLPWLFWAWHRMFNKPTTTTWMLAALNLALVLLAHSLTLLMTVPFLVGFLIWSIIGLPASVRRHALLQSILSIVFAMGLCAFYWLPFVAQLSFVRMGNGLPIISALLPEHLLNLGQLVQPNLLYEYGTAPFGLSLAPILLGLISATIALLARHLRFRAVVLVFAVLGMIYAGSMITPMQNLWLTIPTATMIQYPWRMSLLVGLLLALVIGALPTTMTSYFSERVKPFVRLLVFAVMAGILIFSSQANLAPQQLGFPNDDLNIAQLARLEEYSGFVGTNTWGEYLPTSFQVQTLSAYRATAQSAAQATVTISRYDATRREILVNATNNISLTLRALYYPDWCATIDGQPANVYASTPLGLVTIDVPAGEHRILFFQGTTSARQIGTVISVLSILGWCVLLWHSRRDCEACWLFVVSLALLALVALPASVALSAPVPQTQSVQVDVSPALRVIGLRVTSAQLSNETWQVGNAPSVLRLQVIWHVQQTLEDKPLTWQLVDDRGEVRASRTQLARYGSGFASTWIPNEIVDDWYDISIDSMPAGRYALSATAGSVQPVVVTHIQFTRDVYPEIKVDPPHVLDAQIGGKIRLLGYDAPDIVRGGEHLPLDVFWQASQNVGDDYTIFAQLHDSRGESVAQMDSIPGGGLVPTFLWVPGETVKDRMYLNLPRDLRPGVYDLIVGMYRYPDLKRLPVIVDGMRASDDVAVLGEVKVPGRAQVSPTKSLNARLGSVIQLRGYDFVREKDTAKLTLYWQASAKVDADYSVFVHVVDENGIIVAQQDRQPDNGRYPTRIWDAGETIVDSYSFANLPPGRYRILVGMYSRESGERLQAFDASGKALADRQILVTSFDWANR